MSDRMSEWRGRILSIMPGPRVTFAALGTVYGMLVKSLDGPWLWVVILGVGIGLGRVGDVLDRVEFDTFTAERALALAEAGDDE